MRLSLVLLVFLFAGTVHSQVTYTSYYTKSYPTIFSNKLELVRRQITLSPNSVSIITEVDKGKEIEVLRIQEINNVNGRIILSCTRKNNTRVTVSLPDAEPVESIDYFSIHPKTGEEYQLKFFIQGHFGN